MGGLGGCDRRIEVFGKIQKKKFFWKGGSGGGGGRLGGVRVDLIEELMFLGKFAKKKIGGGGRVGLVGGSGSGGWVEGSGWGRSGWMGTKN